jgi:glucosamine--fructose-6-phosphate aminotransferase (isomerizing)
MELEIPKSIQKALDRTAHPYHMWDGIESIPDHLLTLFEESRLNSLQRVAEKLNDYPYLDMIGCGTSLFASMLAGHAFAAYAGKRVSAQNAFEYLAYPLPDLHKAVLIGVSHTGGTPVVVQSVEMVNYAGGLTVGLTDVDQSRLASTAKEVISTGFGGELALPKTRSFMTTLLNLYLLAYFTGSEGKPSTCETLNTLRSLPERIRAMAPSLNKSTQAILSKLPSLRRVIVIGGGPQYPIALEGSLKITESALMDSAAWELEEAAHGTWAGTKAGDLVVILGMRGASLAKSVKLAQALRRIGAQVWVISNAPEAYTDYDFMTTLETGDLSELYIPFLSVLPLYQFAYHYAISLGVNPDSMNMSDPNYLQARTQIRESF